MAEDKQSNKKPRVRKIETQRQKVEKSTSKAEKPKRVRKLAGSAAKPAKAVGRGLRKEYHPIKLPDNKVGRFFTKRRKWIPKYFRGAWAELRLVTWPSRKESWKLTLAVFLFAIIFGTIITITDYGLDKLFRRIILN